MSEDLEVKPPWEIVPKRSVTVPLSWLVYFVIVLVSLSVGYGGYKVGFVNQVAATEEVKKESKDLRTDLNQLTYEMGRLKQSVDDLRESFDRKK